ncbi:MAG: M15 family metallopeptidase [Enterobacterales bacterium]|nr:M15 family metallopeptidase [Enterobacterales bacterium]
MKLSWQQIIGATQNHLTSFEPDSKHRFLIHPDIKQDLAGLLDAAQIAGQPIALISSFRSFDRQLTLWNQKWLGNLKVYALDGQLIDISELSDEDKFHRISLWSALPGFSRHHWGTDIDIFSAKAIEQGHKVELVTQEFESGGVCESLNQWFDENLQNYGFFRPYQSYQQGIAAEPWHISHHLTAESIREAFPMDECQSHLAQSSIKSGAFIIQNCQSYFDRYFNNICHSNLNRTE